MILFAIFQRYFARDRDARAQGLVQPAAPALVAVEADGVAPPRETVLGLDIGGTKIAAGVVDGTGRVHAFRLEPTHAARGPEEASSASSRSGGPGDRGLGLEIDAAWTGAAVRSTTSRAFSCRLRTSRAGRD